MHHILLWIGFVAAVLPLLALDLGVFHRKAHTVTMPQALKWTGLWVGLALTFAAGVFTFRGPTRGMEFLTGYVIEQSLSADNLFLFGVIFASLHIPAAYQHRVLTWGVVSAIVMRGLIILLGAALIAQFHWILYVFGGFLIWTGVRMILRRKKSSDPSESRLYRWLHRHLPLTTEYSGQKFFTHKDGRRVATPLFLALLLVELMDLVFAVDSIPAVFAVTRDPFIVFSSNVFAVMGLRSLYFVLAGMMDRFHYLKAGLSAILVFVGFKMLDLIEIPVGVSLMTVISILLVAIGASLRRARRLDEMLVRPAIGPEPRQEE